MSSSRPRIVVGPNATTRRRLFGWLLALLVCAAVGFGAGSRLAGDRGLPEAKNDQALSAAGERIQRLEQRLAILKRGNQVTELANRELKAELVAMESEVARLTNEVGFYQRLVGAGGSDRGLAVHALQLEATPSERVFRFELTLSQNLKKAKQIAGRLELAVEGVRSDRATVLDWAGLGVRMDGDHDEFEFKYFQQMNGSFQLPVDFHPQRVIVSLHPDGDAPEVVQSFAWTDLIEEIRDV